MQTFLLRKNTLPYNLLSHIRELHSLHGRNSGITMPLTPDQTADYRAAIYGVWERREKRKKAKVYSKSACWFLSGWYAWYSLDGLTRTKNGSRETIFRWVLTICVEPKPVTLPRELFILTLQLKVSATIACFSAHSRIFLPLVNMACFRRPYTASTYDDVL